MVSRAPRPLAFLFSCFVSLLLAGMPLAAPLMAQDEVSTISVNVKVVNVLATVRDQRGNIINSLNKEDFTLQEDGRPQTIKYFNRESDLPLSLGLLSRRGFRRFIFPGRRSRPQWVCLMWGWLH